jgi:hypothetical protein
MTKKAWKICISGFLTLFVLMILLWANMYSQNRILIKNLNEKADTAIVNNAMYEIRWTMIAISNKQDTIIKIQKHGK